MRRRRAGARLPPAARRPRGLRRAPAVCPPGAAAAGRPQRRPLRLRAARPQAGRLRGARRPRHRPVRAPAGGGRRRRPRGGGRRRRGRGHGDRVRRRPPPAGAAQPARPGAEVQRHRGRGAAARPARRHLLAAQEGARPQGHAGAGRGPAAALRRAPLGAGPCDAGRHRPAGPVRGAVRVRGDCRPDGGHRRHQGRPAARPADGPPAGGRRRLRQDRGRHARRLQGGRWRLPGRGPGADHDPGRPAPGDLPAPLRRLPGRGRDGVALPHPGRDQARPPAARRRPGGHPHRHPPAAQPGHPHSAPRAAGGGRGAALRGGPEGAAAAAQEERPRAVDDRHPGAAHPAAVAGRGARPVGDRDPAAGPHGGRDRDRAVRPDADPGSDRFRAPAGRSDLLRLQPRRGHRGDGRSAARAGARPAADHRPRPDGRRASWPSGCTPSSAASTTCCWPPPSSRTASTSPTSTP